MIACGCEVCHSTDHRDQRLRASILVQSAHTTLVVDAGPDFRQQMLRHGVEKLDAILLTHSHKDHIAGLDDLRAYNFFQRTAMPVYGDRATLNRVQMEFDYAFAAVRYAGVPTIELHQLDGESTFTVGDIEIKPVKVWHLNMPVLGFRFGAFTYITDANRIEDNSKDLIRGSRILALNALRQQEHISHFSLKEAIVMSEELEIPTSYFIHISHQMGLHQQVESSLPDGRYLAYDGLEIKITNDC